jgi:nucleoside-diphosphate-sugar epimerase
MKRVVVTGGSGFVAEWVIKEFLDHGYEVAASVRSASKGERVRTELSAAVSAENLANLSFFEADLTSSQGWEEAMRGADGVIHVASPLGNGTETTEQMVAVAKNGTLTVLAAAKAAGVGRVVMTSSQAASTPTSDFSGVLDESFWSDPSNPELDPYRISKIEAERATWDFASSHNLELSTVLPGAIFGPVLSPKNLSSNAILLQILKGQPMIPQVPLEISDVRDLAVLHRLAFEVPDAAGHRYLAASQHLSMVEVAQIFRREFPDLHVTVRAMPKWLTRLVAVFVPQLRSLVPMLNRKYSHTTAAAEKELGWTQHKPVQTVTDAARALIDFGIVKKSAR